MGLVAVVVGHVVAAALTVQPLPVGTDVDYQLGGDASVPSHVGIVVRDRTSVPLEGVYNVCYVNGFQTQPDQKQFWRQHRQLVLHRHGRPVVDQAWGEWLLDTSTAKKRRALARIVGGWAAGCAEDGFDAVEFDNLDSFTRSHRLLTRKDNLGLARLLIERAHRAGLAVGQKNLAGLNGTKIGYDFAVAEECGRYRECRRYVAHYADAVVMIEYRRQDFEWTCAHYGEQVAVELRDRDLSPDGVHEWC